MNNSKEKYLEEDEIDLKELISVLWKYKLFILFFTLLVTILSVVYVFLFKPIPIYAGTLFVNIGQVKTEKGMIPISNMNNLKIILETELSNNSNDNILVQDIKVEVPRGTNGILKLSSTQYEENKIKEKINIAYSSLLKIEKEKTIFYKDFIKTKKIGNINIKNKPINLPKKKLIVMVSFFSGFVISIFLVFFMQFIISFKEEKEKND